MKDTTDAADRVPVATVAGDAVADRDAVAETVADAELTTPAEPVKVTPPSRVPDAFDVEMEVPTRLVVVVSEPVAAL